MLGQIELRADREAVTWFPLEPLPASARILMTLEGGGIVNDDGEAVDANGDGVPGGGRGTWEFDTAPIHGLVGTAVQGRVLAIETQSRADVPLAGVTITVDGAKKTLRTVTASDGSFRLEPSPAGRFFVHVDGRTAVGSEWPGGAFYPFVGKA